MKARRLFGRRLADRVVALALLLALLVLSACSGGAKRTAAPSAPSTAAVRATSSMSPAPSTTASASTIAQPTTSPSAAVATGSPPAGANGLQSRLEGALLDADELPSGYMRTNVPSHADFLPATDATAVAVFARASDVGPGAEQIVLSLFGFRDALSAANGLGQTQNAVQGLTALPGSALAVAPIPSDVTIADGTQSYRIAGSLAGVGISGFAVYWRHGSVVAGVVEFGADTSVLPAQVDALARAQDARLTAAGF